MMHGFNWDKWNTSKPTERLALIPAAEVEQNPPSSNSSHPPRSTQQVGLE
jgi:hypothetical protein